MFRQQYEKMRGYKEVNAHIFAQCFGAISVCPLYSCLCTLVSERTKKTSPPSVTSMQLSPRSFPFPLIIRYCLFPLFSSCPYLPPFSPCYFSFPIQPPPFPDFPKRGCDPPLLPLVQNKSPAVVISHLRSFQTVSVPSTVSRLSSLFPSRFFREGESWKSGKCLFQSPPNPPNPNASGKGN